MLSKTVKGMSVIEENQSLQEELNETYAKLHILTFVLDGIYKSTQENTPPEDGDWENHHRNFVENLKEKIEIGAQFLKKP